MKKIFIGVMILVAVILIAQDVNNINSNGQLPRDGRLQPIQTGRWMRPWDGDRDAVEHLDQTNFTTATSWSATNDISIDSLLANWKIAKDEHLDQGNFTTVTSWTATNDITIDSLVAKWTWVDSVVSTLTQANADLAIAFEASQSVVLEYTVYDSFAVTKGDVTFTIGGFCETSSLSLEAGDHTYYITTSASAATDDVVFSIKADPHVRSGIFSIDDVSIYSYPTSTLAQANADFATAMQNNQNVSLQYTIYDSVTVTGGTAPLTFIGFDDTLSISNTAGTHTYYMTTDADADTSFIYFSITPTSRVTAGEYSIDDISIGSYNESPITIANGADVTFTVPDNAVEFVIDPKGTAVKVEINTTSYEIETLHSIPCSGMNTIKIANDSGGSVSLNFYFSSI